MFDATCDSLLGCMGVIANVASFVFQQLLLFIRLLLAILDGLWQAASLAASVATAVLEVAFTAVSAVGEFVVDVGHLLAGVAKLAVFLAMSAASGVRSMAGALETLVTVLGQTGASAWHFAGQVADGWATLPRRMAASAASADVRAFESTRWFVVTIAEALGAAAYYLAKSALDVVRFILALPHDTVVWLESLAEQCVVTASGALLGACRAVCILLTDGAYSVTRAVALNASRAAAGVWSNGKNVDWPSKLVVCAAIVGLVLVSVVETYSRLRHGIWWRRNSASQDANEQDREHDGYDDHARAYRANNSAPSSHPVGSHSGSAGAASQTGSSGSTSQTGGRDWHTDGRDASQTGSRDLRTDGRGASQTGSGDLQTDGRRQTGDGDRRSDEQATRPRPPDQSSRNTFSRRAESATQCGGGGGDGLGGAVQQLQQQLDAERDKQLCVVCQHSSKSVILLPCRHLCVCPECAHRISSHLLRRERSCPLCRTEISSAIEAYT